MELNQAELVEKAQAIRALTQTRGWKILEDHWRRHLLRRRTELASFLRNSDFNRASQWQGQVDGIEYILNEIERLSHVKEDEINPSY